MCGWLRLRQRHKLREELYYKQETQTAASPLSPSVFSKPAAILAGILWPPLILIPGVNIVRNWQLDEGSIDEQESRETHNKRQGSWPCGEPTIRETKGLRWTTKLGCDRDRQERGEPQESKRKVEPTSDLMVRVCRGRSLRAFAKSFCHSKMPCQLHDIHICISSINSHHSHRILLDPAPP